MLGGARVWAAVRSAGPIVNHQTQLEKDNGRDDGIDAESLKHRQQVFLTKHRFGHQKPKSWGKQLAYRKLGQHTRVKDLKTLSMVSKTVFYHIIAALLLTSNEALIKI